MGRITSAAYDAAIAAVITSPTHLVEIGFVPDPARWSDAGSITLGDGRQFTQIEMNVGSFRFSMDQPVGGITLRVNNMNNAVGALFLNSVPAELPVAIYAADMSATAVADVPLLGNFTIQGVRIGPEYVDMTLTPWFFSAPLRRVDAAHGFNHATPVGTRIVWGTEVFVMEAE